MNRLRFLPCQTGGITVEVVSIAGVRARIGVLPEGVVTDHVHVFISSVFLGWYMNTHGQPAGILPTLEA